MDDITSMAREVSRYADIEFQRTWESGEGGSWQEFRDERFAALVAAAERNKLAAWMMAQGYATGHGDTIEGLLEELDREIGFKRAELWIKRINDAVLAEREACLNCYSPDDTAQDWADKIRARSQA
jgi:hypothetical protein